MTDLAEIDYFTNAGIAQDPYAYWDYLRSAGPVVHEPHLRFRAQPTHRRTHVQPSLANHDR